MPILGDWSKRRIMGEVHKIKPGTMAALMSPGKTHFSIEFDGEKKPDPILTPNQWHDLCAEIGRLVTRDGLFNVREALDTFKVNQKPR
jgi:hypothetical protein